MSLVRSAHSAPRFAVVGVGNFFVSFAVFYLCYHYLPAGGASGAVANVFAYVAGMINSFVWNRSWTFNAEGGVAGQALRFTVVNLVSLSLGTLVVHVFVDRMHYPELAVWIPLAVLIVIMNYLGCKYWAFAPRRAVPAETSI